MVFKLSALVGAADLPATFSKCNSATFIRRLQLQLDFGELALKLATCVLLFNATLLHK